MVVRPDVLVPMALLIAFSSGAAFGLMMFFQPGLDPTRATLVYLLEPVWAALYAWVVAGKSLSTADVQGAALILLANGFVEWFAARQGRNASMELPVQV